MTDSVAPATITIDGVEYRRTLGVPYAFSRVKGRKAYKECPRCHALIPTTHRKDFESFSGIEYADHYEAEHAKDDGRIRVNGVSYERVDD